MVETKKSTSRPPTGADTNRLTRHAESLVLKKDHQLKVTIAMLVGIVVASFWTGVAYNNLTSQHEGFRKELLALRVEIDETREELLKKSDFRWTWPMERHSWRDFQDLNPDIQIPDIEQIRKDYEIYIK